MRGGGGGFTHTMFGLGLWSVCFILNLVNRCERTKFSLSKRGGDSLDQTILVQIICNVEILKIMSFGLSVGN